MLSQQRIAHVINDLIKVWAIDFDDLEMYGEIFKGVLRYYGFTEFPAFDIAERIPDFEPWQADGEDLPKCFLDEINFGKKEPGKIWIGLWEEYLKAIALLSGNSGAYIHKK